MGLREYFRKRSFSKTPEPKGAKKTAATGHQLRFVVQEHHASRLHYDFRLEIDGVLKSWAVPKGPSMDPHDHHLAVQTEDHPYDYRNFEGVIPEGNYGAGNVIIWDEGWYEARKDDGKSANGGSERTLRSELKDGHITFVLHGKKLKGEFALIKMHDTKEENAWLLIKKSDEFATTADITKQDTSVRSHHKVDDLGAHNRLPDLSAYPRIGKPWVVKPMLCTLVDEPFSRENWLFEIKWDGYRAIGSKHKSTIELYSRNGLDFSERYIPVAEALRGLDHDVVVDGEIVVVDAGGSAHFEWLQGWKKEPQGNLQYYIFDILWCDGHDVRSMPLAQRKALLKVVLPTKDNTLKFSDDLPEKGLELFKEMQRRGMEGMVAKRADSPYRENDRGQDWLKIKTHLRQEVVIGGFTEPRGGRKYLGSLLVGVYDKKGNYIYVGHSGGGIPDNQRKELHQKLLRLERKTSPFTIEPKPNAPVHWVRPEVVCEMSFSEWTHDGSMRHPQFEGLRPDKEPSQVRREQPKARKKPDGPVVATTSTATGEDVVDRTGVSGSRELPFEATHLDKVFFPKHKYTKGDLFAYYELVADYILPYLKDRPLSMNRMPDGIKGPSFFQKNNEHLPDWVPSADIFSDSNNANLHWVVGGKLDTLLYIVQLGSIEINPWNSRINHLDKPDWIVIDLDPEGIGFEQVIEVARTVKEVCDEWGIPSHPKTSGKTGLHIYIPMGAKYTYEQAKNLAHLIVLEVNKRQPKITSVERMPEKRKHKIYLDFLQNREGQTLAAPYSVRPTPEASVSMPLHWDEVKSGLKPSDFTIQNTPPRLKRIGDIWEPVAGKGIDLSRILKNIENGG
ncbi:MAG TPA: DNA ligase D [Candidatus Saccharimonadales bacterium]|nr:DNA ligase D [Candidatus Saccharimonadales bacterium]